MTEFYSPLRYPGGKQRLAEFISQVCLDNNVSGHYVEPYAGGASIALHLLLTNRMREITINDFDKAIYAFWWATINEANSLCEMIENTDITIGERIKQAEVLKNKATEGDLTKLGFATLFLNRTGYSGALNAGAIGGKHQNGAYRIDCRFNKSVIIERIKRIAAFADRIHVANLDALDLVDSIKSRDNTIFYFDPPYYLKGKSLYMNHYKKEDHRFVCEKIRAIRDALWIVTYDDTPEIHELYSGVNMSLDYELRHNARSSRVGKESIFFSDGLKVELSTSRLLVKGPHGSQ